MLESQKDDKAILISTAKNDERLDELKDQVEKL